MVIPAPERSCRLLHLSWLYDVVRELNVYHVRILTFAVVSAEGEQDWGEQIIEDMWRWF